MFEYGHNHWTNRQRLPVQTQSGRCRPTRISLDGSSTLQTRPTVQIRPEEKAKGKGRSADRDAQGHSAKDDGRLGTAEACRMRPQGRRYVEQLSREPSSGLDGPKSSQRRMRQKQSFRLSRSELEHQEEGMALYDHVSEETLLHRLV